MNRLLRIDVLIFGTTVLFFLWQPYFDLQVSHLFYDQSKGGFWLNGTLTSYIYHGTNTIGRSIIILLIVCLFVAVFLKVPSIKRYQKVIVFLLLCGLLGPILVTDTLLKKNMDRPRPNQTQQFGGEYPFQPPFFPSSRCQSCESFVSGHAAVGFYFLSVVLLFPQGSVSRKRWLGFALSMGILVSTVRVLQGGHYLSDVIFSGFVVWFSSLLVYEIIYGDRLKRFY